MLHQRRSVVVYSSSFDKYFLELAEIVASPAAPRPLSGDSSRGGHQLAPAMSYPRLESD